MLSMVVARKVVLSAMEVARQKMGELLIQSAPFSNESLNETADPDSSASSDPGIIKENNIISSSGVVSSTMVRALVLGRFSQKRHKEIER